MKRKEEDLSVLRPAMIGFEKYVEVSKDKACDNLWSKNWTLKNATGKNREKWRVYKTIEGKAWTRPHRWHLSKEVKSLFSSDQKYHRPKASKRKLTTPHTHKERKKENYIKYHRHQGVLTARFPSTLSRHPSPISALSKSSRWHPISARRRLI